MAILPHGHRRSRALPKGLETIPKESLVVQVACRPGFWYHIYNRESDVAKSWKEMNNGTEGNEIGRLLWKVCFWTCPVIDTGGLVGDEL